MNESVFCRRSTRRRSVSTLLVIGLGWLLPQSAVGLPPEGVPKEARAFSGLNNDAIEAWTAGNRLFLDLKGLPAAEDGTIKIARLANVLKKIYWLSDTASKVELQPEPGHWLITLTERPKVPSAVVVIELDEPARVFAESFVSEPGSDRIITLPAKLVITHGSLLRFEPQPHKNTVGYWANVKDTAEWRFHVQQSGSYEVDILQGCGKGHGGSRVELQVEEQKLTFEVQETGHFQNFIWRTIGTVNLPETETGVLNLVPVHKAAGAVMDVRAVRLAPVGTKRSFESELADPAALPKEQ